MFKRFRAKRTSCLFVDKVNHREVWLWEYKGRQWMGQSRFGLWVPRVIE